MSRLVDRYRLSGFCGFDFILTETGEPKLLEVNPRVTPTAHLLVDGCLDSGRVVTLSSTQAIEGRRRTGAYRADA